eukprot:4613476-Alexandrium_andersonii.AAC.1
MLARTKASASPLASRSVAALFPEEERGTPCAPTVIHPKRFGTRRRASVWDLTSRPSGPLRCR